MEFPKVTKPALRPIEKRIPYTKDTIVESGGLRLLKSGSKIFSINNQANFKTTEDTIIKLTQNGIGNTKLWFAKPQELLFASMIPCLVDKARDEWTINIEDTVEYVIPESHFQKSLKQKNK